MTQEQNHENPLDEMAKRLGVDRDQLFPAVQRAIEKKLITSFDDDYVELMARCLREAVSLWQNNCPSSSRDGVINIGICIFLARVFLGGDRADDIVDEIVNAPAGKENEGGK